MEIAVRDDFSLAGLNRRMPVREFDELDDNFGNHVLGARLYCWRAGAMNSDFMHAEVFRYVAEAVEAGDIAEEEQDEMVNRIAAVLALDPTLKGPPSPRAAGWVGRAFDDEQRQDLLVVAAGQYLAGALPCADRHDAAGGAMLFDRLRALDWTGLPDAEIATVAAALAQRAARSKAENRVRGIVPQAGYGLETFQNQLGNGSYVNDHAVDPGLWRLRIIGDWYELECELWPCAVAMKSVDFLRARSSAREIFKQAGIQVDSPAGHWRKVWEVLGLRDQLLQAADRDDPGERAARVATWLRTIEGSAPTADRAASDGSAVRLPDGAVAASMPWLVAQSIGDAIARESERAAVETIIRANTGETTRRVEGGRAVRLRCLPSKIPLVIEGISHEIEKLA